MTFIWVCIILSVTGLEPVTLRSFFMLKDYGINHELFLKYEQDARNTFSKIFVNKEHVLALADEAQNLRKPSGLYWIFRLCR